MRTERTANALRGRLRRERRLEKLLERSQAFEGALSTLLGQDGLRLFEESPKVLACAGACALSIEHAGTVRLSFAAGAPNSGTALLRLQFEALLRGAWLLHAATDQQAAKLTRSLDSEAEQLAKNMPGAVDMIEALGRKAPAGLVLPLQQFQSVSLKALNSFVHSGIHPLRRVSEGFPQALGEQIVRNSNGLMHFGYRLLASLCGSQDLMNQTTRIYREFEDCLPMA